MYPFVYTYNKARVKQYQRSRRKEVQVMNSLRASAIKEMPRAILDYLVGVYEFLLNS